MTSNAKNVEEYISELADERRDAFVKLRKVILDNLPKGFEETMLYGMVGYVVPHSIFPAGYHCNSELALYQKNFA